MKRLAITAIVFLLCCAAFAQRYNVRAERFFSISLQVADSLSGEPVPFSSVYLVPVRDSIITNFTLSDQKGQAEVSRILRGEYVLHVEMLGYRHWKRKLYVDSSRQLGTILLSLDAEVLDAAKATASVSPLEIRQDTLIYHAGAYAVEENEVLQDLLKKMPGIEVKENGQVSVQGDPVETITVNGKTFFMGDRRAALENIPAKAVDKIVVTDNDADVAWFTGIRKSGNDKKKMDVNLKQEYSQGFFGRLEAMGGASVPDKEQDEMMATVPFLWHAGGMLAWFSPKNQWTLLGRGNNTETALSLKPASGLVTGAQAGANYATELIPRFDSGLSVYYTRRSKEDALRSVDKSYPTDGRMLETDRYTASGSTRESVNLSLAFKRKRNRELMFSFSPKLVFSRNGSMKEQEGTTQWENGEEQTSSASSSASDSRSIHTSGHLSFLYGKLGKEGRSLGLESSYGLNVSEGNRTEDFKTVTATSPGTERLLRYDDRNSGGNVSMGLSYVEPLTEILRLRAQVNGSFSRGESSKLAFNPDGTMNPYYSTKADNRTLSSSGDLLLQLSTKGHTLHAGVRVIADQIRVLADAQGVSSAQDDGKWQWRLAPSLFYTFNKFRLVWSGQSSLPDQSALFPGLDYSNPLCLRTGNVWLKPSFTQTLSIKNVFKTKKKPDYLDLSLRGTLESGKIVDALWYDAERIRYAVPVNTRKPSFSVDFQAMGSWVPGASDMWRIEYGAGARYGRTVSYQRSGTAAGLDLDTFDYETFLSDFWGNAAGDRFYAGESGFRESLTRSCHLTPWVDIYFRWEQLSALAGFHLVSDHVWYTADASTNVHTYVPGMNWTVNYRTPHAFSLRLVYDFSRYCGFSSSMPASTHMLHFSLTKDIRSFTLSFLARNLLNSGLPVSHSISPSGSRDSFGLALGRNFLLGLTWHFGRKNERNARAAQAADREGSGLM